MNPYLLSYDILGTGRRKPENFITNIGKEIFIFLEIISITKNSQGKI